MDLGLRGKVALVTGSTAGLGLASAKALAHEGAAVIVTGRRGHLAKEIAAGLPAAHGIGADLTDPSAPERLVTTALEVYDRLDILVGSVGGPPPGTALDTDADAYDDTLNLLVKPMVRLAHQAIPEMRRQGGGRIVFVTSATVREPHPFLVLSNAVRMAVHGFAKSLSKQVASDGITVNCVMPGRIATDRIEQLDSAAAETSGRSIEEVREANQRGIPVGRYGDPAELGHLVAYLCSSHAAYVTGTSIPVDGGILASHW